MPTTPISIAPAAQPFVDWAHSVLLPMWRDRGIDPDTGFAHEALDRAGQPVSSGFHRTLVAARLAYFYTRCAVRQPDDPAWRTLAAEQAALLDAAMRDPVHGGWFTSVKAPGVAHDAEKDLYTHAFVVLAFAEYAALTGDTAWLARADEAFITLQAFASPDGTWLARARRDFSEGLAGPAQNPLMHCFEAVSRLVQLTDAPAHHAGLVAIADVIERDFALPDGDRILELPVDTPDNRVEPGHQFEWFSLAAASPLADRLGVAPGGRVHRMLRRALAEGTTAEHLVPLACEPDYAPRDPVHRVWTQLECIRALHTAHLLEGDDASAAGRDAALAALQTHFLRPDGWVEVIHAGQVIRAEQPGSTPYHFMTCLDVLTPTDAA